MQDLLRAVAAPSTCLNTTEARRTVAFLNEVDLASTTRGRPCRCNLNFRQFSPIRHDRLSSG
jgi:hypothetical protein